MCQAWRRGCCPPGCDLGLVQLCLCPETANDGKTWGSSFPLEKEVPERLSVILSFSLCVSLMGLGETSLWLSLACVLYGVTFCVQRQDVISLSWFGVCPRFEISELCEGVSAVCDH